MLSFEIRKDMKRLLMTTTIGLTALSLYAQAPQRSILKGFLADSTSIRLDYVLACDTAVGSDYALCYTPMLSNGRGDSLLLKPIVFRGKRNRRYVERGRFYGNMPPSAAEELPANVAKECSVTLLRNDYPWLWKGRIVLGAKVEKEGCCQVEDMPMVSVGAFAYVPPFVPLLADVEDNTGKAGELQRDNPVLQHISQYRPYDDTRILRKEKGALYVHFPVGKGTLRRDYRDNAATLDRIVRITRSVMADTTSSVKLIQIVGLASVEGSRQGNVKLAGTRAEVLKRYIQQHVDTPDALYECANGGEAWTELRDQIADSQFEGKEALLRVIDTEKDLDRREWLIKQVDNGKPYAYLREHILSDQRNAGYIRVYYDYVPDSAAKVINEATALLRQGKYAEALRMLKTVEGDERAQNALGVAYYMTGQRQQGIDRMRRAAAEGNEQAKRNIERLDAIEAAKTTRSE